LRALAPEVRCFSVRLRSLREGTKEPYLSG
jgi:hypothetical protein